MKEWIAFPHPTFFCQKATLFKFILPVYMCLKFKEFERYYSVVKWVKTLLEEKTKTIESQIRK